MEQFSVALNLPEGNISLSFDRIHGSVRISDIVLKLLSIGDIVTELGTNIASNFGKTVSCKKGCGVCCCQMVPLSPPEAIIITNVVDNLPENRKKIVLEHFKSAKEKLLKAELYDTIFQIYSNSVDNNIVTAINEKYFRLQLQCPFLVDGSCSIYQYRPSRCREYSVMSSSDLCMDPFSNSIKRLPITLKFCESLSFAWSSLFRTPPIIIPLVGALDWVQKHSDIRDAEIEGGESFIKAVLEYACKRANIAAQKKLAN